MGTVVDCDVGIVSILMVGASGFILNPAMAHIRPGDTTSGSAGDFIGSSGIPSPISALAIIWVDPIYRSNGR
jgi:hypothetical protein